MAVVHHVADLADPRLADYLHVRERQLHDDFSPPDGLIGGPVRADAGLPASSVPAAPFGKFMAEGELVFQRLVGSSLRTLSVLCTPTRLETIRPQLDRLAPDLPVYVVPPKQMEALVGFNLHRGLLAVAARPAPRSVAEVIAATGSRPILIAEDLTNHDNIGSLFRNGAALGAGALLLSPRCADPLYRKCVRVSMGYALTLPWAIAQPWPVGVLSQLRAAGYLTLALTPAADAVDLESAASTVAGRRFALLLGSEGPGLTPAAQSAADLRVRIPMASGVDSLNVATSAAVALYRFQSGRPARFHPE